MSSPTVYKAALGRWYNLAIVSSHILTSRTSLRIRPALAPSFLRQAFSLFVVGRVIYSIGCNYNFVLEVTHCLLIIGNWLI